MIKQIALAGLLIVPLMIAVQPAGAGTYVTHCGYGGWAQDAGRSNVYRIRTPYIAGDGKACVGLDGTTYFKITAVPAPKAGNRYGYVTTYPSEMTGCLHGLCTPKHALPLKASSIKSEWSSVSTTENAPGTWNASYDLWYGTTPQTDGHPDAAELMVWINHHGRCCFLAGNAVRVHVEGRTWILTHWRAYDRKVHVGWTYIQFRLLHPRWSMNYVNLKQFAQVAIDRGLLKRYWYQLTASFGYEVWTGGVGNTVDRFRCMVLAR